MESWILCAQDLGMTEAGMSKVFRAVDPRNRSSSGAEKELN